VRHARIVVPLLAVALLSACGLGDTGEGQDATPPTPDTTGTGPATGAALPADLRERPAVATALADAATRQNVTTEQVKIAAWSPVTWNDGSIGCPEPGTVYTQATVDGELLLLRVDMTLLAYHAGADGVFSFCADPEGTYSVRAS
jgi:hypothetical protein